MGRPRIKRNTISLIGILINSFYMDICRRKFGACILAGLASRAIALPPRPKLLVLLVLEHLRPDYLDAVWGQVGPGGLRRIVEGGAFFPDCRHLASSFSSSSLATLATGAWPAQHGIVADTWYDRASRRPVRASDEALLATTLTAQVTVRPGHARVCDLFECARWVPDFRQFRRPRSFGWTTRAGSPAADSCPLGAGLSIGRSRSKTFTIHHG